MKYFEEYRDYLVGMKNLKISTAKNYLYKLTFMEKHFKKPIPDVTEKEFQDYFISIRNSKSVNSQRLDQTAVRMFFGWYCSLNNIPNPVEKLIIIKRERISPAILTQEDFIKLVEVCGTTKFKSIRNAAMLCLLADTGIRVGELVKLKVGNVSKEENRFMLSVTGSITGSTKTYRQRTIPFCELKEREIIAEHWSAYWSAIKYDKCWGTEDPLFQRGPQGGFGEGGETSISTVQALMRRLTRDAGIEKNITPHSFRHFYATYCVANDMRLETLKGRLGHSNMESVMRYVQLADLVKEDSLKHNPMRGIHTKQFKGFVKIMKEVK